MDKGYIIIISMKNDKQKNDKPKMKPLNIKQKEIDKFKEKEPVSPIFTNLGIIDGTWSSINDVYWR